MLDGYAAFADERLDTAAFRQDHTAASHPSSIRPQAANQKTLQCGHAFTERKPSVCIRENSQR
jgi:hypothetical protein